VIVTAGYKRSPTGPILASVVRVGETVEVRNGSRVRQLPGAIPRSDGNPLRKVDAAALLEVGIVLYLH
jgi:hypothetical protein